MTGLDTNVLVRLFAQDDLLQSMKADEIMGSLSAEAPGWVSIAVLMELVWVLSYTYRARRAEVASILNRLASNDQIVIEQVDTVRKALRLFDDGKAGFADCLIACLASAAGCTRTLTFDRRAARDAGMQLIG